MTYTLAFFFFFFALIIKYQYVKQRTHYLTFLSTRTLYGDIIRSTARDYSVPSRSGPLRALSVIVGITASSYPSACVCAHLIYECNLIERHKSQYCLFDFCRPFHTTVYIYALVRIYNVVYMCVCVYTYARQYNNLERFQCRITARKRFRRRR